MAVLGAATLKVNVAPPSLELNNKLAEPLESASNPKSEAKAVVSPFPSIDVTVQTIVSSTCTTDVPLVPPTQFRVDAVVG